MAFQASILLVFLLLASTAGAETVYKYRRADGQTIYSNRFLRDAELIESFEYRFAAPAAPAASSRAAPASTAAVDQRMKQHLAALDSAWNEVQAATKALTAAEARLAAGVAPQQSESAALGGPVALAPSDVGGPQASAAPAAGGPQPPAAPLTGQTVAQAHAAAQAVGGPMGTRRGGGRNAEYVDRMAGLEADVLTARARLDAALKAYNQLR